MTQRLTDDEIRELRTQVLGFHSLRNVIRALDEIEERRRIDPKVVAFIDGVQVPDHAIVTRLVAKGTVEHLPSAIGVPMPKGKDGGA